MKISKQNSHCPPQRNFLSLTAKPTHQKSSNKDLSFTTLHHPHSNNHKNQSDNSHSFYMCPNSATINPNNTVNQHDFREYRVLMHLFAQNINNYYGGDHRDVLGDLEEVHRIHLTNEQKQLMQKRLHRVFQRNIDKFMKELLNRNLHNSKQCQEYLQTHQKKITSHEKLYQCSHVQKKLENPENSQQKTKNRRRPFSSVSISKQQKLSDRYDPENRRSEPHNNKQSTLATIDTQYKNTNINNKRSQSKVCVYCADDEQVFVAENIRKTLPSKPQQNTKFSEARIFKYRNRSQQKNIFVHEDFRSTNMLICETIYDKINTDNNASREVKKCDKKQDQRDEIQECGDKNYGRKIGRPSLQNYERMRISERLFTVNQGNNSLVIQSQFQGYGPKSKCWLNKQLKPTQKPNSGSCSTIQNSPTPNNYCLIQARGQKALAKYKAIRIFK